MESLEVANDLVVCVTGDIDYFRVETIERLEPYLSLLDRYGVKATFFVTARAAEEYPERAEYILKRDHLVEGHGDVHKGFYESESVQIDRLNAMKRVFSKVFDLEIEGFRAPWYKHNPATYLAVDRAGLRYDCSKKRFEIAFKGVPFVQKRYMDMATYRYAKPLLELAGSLYNLYSKSPRLPCYITSNVLEFPTLGISDYSLIGDPRGPRYRPDESIKMGEIWVECLASLKQRGGGVLTLQAHPCRVSPEYLASLDYFIQHALRLGAVFSTPGDLARTVSR
ncbi:MAG: polysaccharide deacetylase family protein [Candidatus Methanoculleus thermohydrogenotrophicum]|jgi:peptidoglycan/xylan/chitin deacetylase (PgdA/CDA1 family)|nr:polysaccharide deacetylase family protein [Candidatus Methanoculleus thermohydrogenotrophicum]HOB43287.1 polysaccharide deacetylase family protein [Bacillota bacterium]